MIQKKFLGEEEIQFVNKDKEFQPFISVGDFVESYFSKENAIGTIDVERKNWFIPELNHKREHIISPSTDLTKVIISQYDGEAFELYSGFDFKGIFLKDEKVILKNIISKRVQGIPVYLIEKWADMYSIPVETHRGNIEWHNVSVKPISYSGRVYTLQFRGEEGILKVNTVFR